MHIKPSDLTLTIWKANPERKLNPVESKKWDTNFTMRFDVWDPDLTPQEGVSHDVNSDVRVSCGSTFSILIYDFVYLRASCTLSDSDPNTGQCYSLQQQRQMSREMFTLVFAFTQCAWTLRCIFISTVSEFDTGGGDIPASRQ